MATVPFRREQWAQEGIFRRDLVNPGQTWPNIREASRINALFPYQNLSNHYFPREQNVTIAPFMPPIGWSMIATVQKGSPATNALSDEAVRQLAAGWAQLQQRTTFYVTANQ